MKQARDIEQVEVSLTTENGGHTDTVHTHRGGYRVCPGPKTPLIVPTTSACNAQEQGTHKNSNNLGRHCLPP